MWKNKKIKLKKNEKLLTILPTQIEEIDQNSPEKYISILKTKYNATIKNIIEECQIQKLKEKGEE